MMVETFKQNLKVYLISFFLYNFARVLPHAVLTVILLDKGMTIGNIAIIQSFFMIAGLIFEFPSGVLTDIWSEKIMYQISLLLLAFSYLIIMISYNFYILCLSWFIYGMSQAAISGSLETYFVRIFNNNEQQIKKLNVAFNNANLYSTLIGGGIGSFIYATFGDHLYVISILIIIISFGLIAIFFHPRKQNITKRPNLKSIFSDMHQLKNDYQLINCILKMGVFQIVIQLFFQFWQVMFLAKALPKSYFGIIYVGFQIGAIVSNYIFERIDLKNKHIILIIFISLLLLAAIYVDNKLIFISLITLFLIPFNLYSNQLMVDIQRKSPSKIVSSVMSFSGTVGSIVSMLFLWSMGILNNFINFNLIASIMIIIFTILSMLFSIKPKKSLRN